MHVPERWPHPGEPAPMWWVASHAYGYIMKAYRLCPPSHPMKEVIGGLVAGMRDTQTMSVYYYPDLESENKDEPKAIIIEFKFIPLVAYILENFEWPNGAPDTITVENSTVLYRWDNA